MLLFFFARLINNHYFSFTKAHCWIIFGKRKESVIKIIFIGICMRRTFCVFKIEGKVWGVNGLKL
jgi:hypothetical protein